MKRLSRVLVTAVVFVGAVTVAAAATPSSVLNTLEVQKLVAAETPIASLRLAAHFNALADQYFAEAAKDRATATVYKAVANRSAVTTAADDCARLASRATAWGARARELARYHIDRAAGREAILPIGATSLHGGFGAPEPSAEQLHKLALTARTRADHLALREYYSMVTRKKAAEADNHLAMATAYRAGVRHGSYDPAVALERLAGIARKAAKEASQAADRHQVFANIG